MILQADRARRGEWRVRRRVFREITTQQALDFPGVAFELHYLDAVQPVLHMMPLHQQA